MSRSGVAQSCSVQISEHRSRSRGSWYSTSIPIESTHRVLTTTAAQYVGTCVMLPEMPWGQIGDPLSSLPIAAGSIPNWANARRACIRPARNSDRLRGTAFLRRDSSSAKIGPVWSAGIPPLNPQKSGIIDRMASLSAAVMQHFVSLKRWGYGLLSQVRILYPVDSMDATGIGRARKSV